MPASERGRLDVEPEMNQSSSAMTARRKTLLVVNSGRIGIKSFDESEEERVSENRSAGGAN